MSLSSDVSKIATATLTTSNIVNNEDTYKWFNGLQKLVKDFVISDIRIDSQKVTFDIKGEASQQNLSPKSIGLKVKEYVSENNPPFKVEKGRIVVNRVIPDPMWDF
jgi:hypothetical protein